MNHEHESCGPMEISICFRQLITFHGVSKCCIIMFWKNRRKIRNPNVVNELIQKVVNNDPQTTKVVLKGVSIPPDLLTTLAMALICNTHVKILYLASLTTPLWPQSALVMASALVQNSSLETVWLEDNQICSIGAASFATVFYANKSIKTFGLRNNLIGNRGKLRHSTCSLIADPLA